MYLSDVCQKGRRTYKGLRDTYSERVLKDTDVKKDSVITLPEALTLRAWHVSEILEKYQ